MQRFKRLVAKFLPLLEITEIIVFCASFIYLSLTTLLFLLTFGIYSPPIGIDWIAFILVITATIISHLVLKYSKRELFKKVVRSFVVNLLGRLLPILFVIFLTQAILSFTITATVRRPPLIFSYGKDSPTVGGEIAGNGNLTFIAHSFPLPNTTMFQVKEVVNITNREGNPWGLILYLIDQQTDNDLLNIRIFEVFLKSRDGRRFLLLEIRNGTAISNESIGFLLPSNTTWSLGMASQGINFHTNNPIHLKFGVKLWEGSDVYYYGMTIEIKLFAIKP